MDFEVFEDEYFDIEVRNQDQIPEDLLIFSSKNSNSTVFLPGDSLDLNLTGNLALAYISLRFSQGFLHVQMAPFSTLGEILGTLGGISSLFVFIIGVPAMYINRLLFGHLLKKAKTRGLVDESMLQRNGTLRLDRANEAVDVLNRVSIRILRKAKRQRFTEDSNSSNQEGIDAES